MMFWSWVFFTVVVGLLFIVATAVLRKRRRREIDAADDSIPANDEIVVINYNGFYLPMRADELELWNSMDRNERREQVRISKEKIANGTIVVIYPDPADETQPRWVMGEGKKIVHRGGGLIKGPTNIVHASPLRKVR